MPRMAAAQLLNPAGKDARLRCHRLTPVGIGRTAQRAPAKTGCRSKTLFCCCCFCFVDEFISFGRMRRRRWNTSALLTTSVSVLICIAAELATGRIGYGWSRHWPVIDQLTGYFSFSRCCPDQLCKNTSVTVPGRRCLVQSCKTRALRDYGALLI